MHGGCRGVVGSVKQVYGGHPIVLLIIWCPMGYACQNSGHIFFAENTSRNYWNVISNIFQFLINVCNWLKRIYFFLHLRVKCQCALPDLNRELQISVGTAGTQPQTPNRKLQSSEWSRCGEPITANLYWDSIVLNMTTKGGFVWNGQHAHIQVNRYQSPPIFVQHQFRTPLTKKENK